MFSDDLPQPPAKWPADRRGSLQQGRFTTLSATLLLPDPAPGLRTLAEAGLFTLEVEEQPALVLTLERPGPRPLRLSL